MESLGKAASKVSGSLASERISGRGVLRAPSTRATLPLMYDPEVDKTLPNSLWCGWRIDGQSRRIRRALTDAERGMLERRIAELEPAMTPCSPADEDLAAEAISDMFASFPGMRATGAEALAKIDSMQKRLAEFPLWAIARACGRIATDGYEVEDKDGKRRERHWPPADGEVVAEVRREVKLRAEALASARALLAAEVDA